jgi:predicted double-glycine peptidase
MILRDDFQLLSEGATETEAEAEAEAEVEKKTGLISCFSEKENLDSNSNSNSNSTEESKMQSSDHLTLEISIDSGMVILTDPIQQNVHHSIR